MGKGTLELKGFDDFYEKVRKISDNADEVAGKKFDECMDILENELRTKASGSGLSSRLVGKISRNAIKTKSNFYGEVGWKSQKKKSGSGISDFHKVVFYNYGTPARKTNKDKQRIKINGKWVTLGTDRGEIIKRGFIKRAKLAASRKTKTLMKNTLKEMLNNR